MPPELTTASLTVIRRVISKMPGLPVPVDGTHGPDDEFDHGVGMFVPQPFVDRLGGSHTVDDYTHGDRATRFNLSVLDREEADSGGNIRGSLPVDPSASPRD